MLVFGSAYAPETFLFISSLAFGELTATVNLTEGLVGTMTALLASIILSQSPLSSGQKFRGFVPSEKVAIAVADPILASLVGEFDMRLARPLKASLMQHRWVVRGTYRGVDQFRNSDFCIEPFVLVIDSWSGRVIAYGKEHLMDVRRLLSSVRWDGDRRPIKRKKRKPN